MSRNCFDIPLALAIAAASCAVLGPVRPAGAAGDPFLRRTAAVSVVEKVGPAVVNITTETQVQGRRPFSGRGGDPLFDRFFRDFFEPGRSRTTRSLGSGVIIDRAGHILTNEHVVSGASRIRVTLSDGREFEATLVGADPNNDLAVLQIESDEALPWVPPARSADILVGEPVIAIGNPFGLSNTVTTGVVSAIDRSIRTGDRAFYGFIQTDASINPGNSGGPLLNAEGGLIAINTAVYQGGQGIGFAVPIDVARRVVDELIAYGEVAPVWLGLELQDLEDELQHELLELPRGTRGALVRQIVSGGPAVGHIQVGDVVTRLDGQKTPTAREYYRILEHATSGQTVPIEVWRDRSAVEIELQAEPIPDRVIEEIGGRLLGLELAPVEGGGFEVRAVRAASSAEKIGFRPGDRLLRINGRALRDPEALRRSFLDLRGRPRALLVVQRGSGRYHLELPLS